MLCANICISDGFEFDCMINFLKHPPCVWKHAILKYWYVDFNFFFFGYLVQYSYHIVISFIHF